MGGNFAIVDLTDVSKASFQTCETEVKKFTDPLGATEMRANQVLVDPGEVTTLHPRGVGGGVRSDNHRRD